MLGFDSKAMVKGYVLNIPGIYQSIFHRNHLIRIVLLSCFVWCHWYIWKLNSQPTLPSTIYSLAKSSRRHISIVLPDRFKYDVNSIKKTDRRGLISHMSHVIRQQKQKAEFDNHLLYNWYCNSEPMLDSAQFHITHFLFVVMNLFTFLTNPTSPWSTTIIIKRSLIRLKIILASAYPRFLYLLSFLQQHVETDDIRYSLETSQW